MKLKNLPPAWAAVARRANRRLILAETRTLKALRDGTRKAVQTARASILLDRMRVVDGLRATVPAIVDSIRSDVLVGRLDAKKQASATFEDELELADIDFEADDPEIEDVDHARAEAVAAAIAAAWLMSGIALADKKDPALEALVLIDFRLRRVAGTEVPQAYGDWHTELASQLDEATGLVQRWDATLDLKTCNQCFDMHGEIAPLDGQFRGGLVPGDVHPNCRCEPTIIPASLVNP